ncbi:MAG TPA: Ku protein [Polyangia bacterium]|nr:Ku protein [Polyangia bacterium]
MRAIASGTISFGLVSIPVKLYSATESSASISFNLLHKDCGSRLKQQYICQKDNQIVPRDQMIKGYEFAKDQYVTFSPEELKELEEKSSEAIEIAEFVPAARIDSLYFDKPYFLGAEKGGEKAYRLLARAMSESGRVGLARYAARGKQYLVMLRPTEDGRIVMQQLHYADEVRSSKDVPLADGEVREQELKLAMQLIDQIAHETFNPQAYEDEVRKRVQAQIQRKVEGQEISVSATEEPKAQIIDLMEALKASLAKKGEAKAQAQAAKAAEPAAAAPVEERKAPKRAARADKAEKKTKASKE